MNSEYGASEKGKQELSAAYLTGNFEPISALLLKDAERLIQSHQTVEALTLCQHIVAFITESTPESTETIRRGLVDVLRDIVQQASQLNDHEAALTALREVKALCGSLKFWPGIFAVTRKEAVLLMERSEWMEALHCLRRTEQVCRALGEREFLPSILAWQAHCLFKINYIEDRRDWIPGWQASWKEALKIAREAQALCSDDQDELNEWIEGLIQVLSIVERDKEK